MQFVRALIERRDSLESFVHPEDLARSRRLGIRYQGIDHKFLIANDLDKEIRAAVDADQVGRDIQTLDPAHKIASLALKVPGMPASLDFIFEDSLIISPLRYFTRHWSVRESDHFRFIVSDSTSLRDYHVANLERFYKDMVTRLGLSEEADQLLAAGKIDYYLCKGEDEVRELTGYTTLGMSNLAYDAVITSYSAHYHELVHLLVNCKLRDVPLFTHSFFQEGLAVALGGRGGKEPGPILELGRFLYESGMIERSQINSDSAFDVLDPSMSYPVAGLYNAFLLEHLGMDAYLELYLRNSGNAEFIRAHPISESELPSDSSWLAYLKEFQSHTTIELGCTPNSNASMPDQPPVTLSGDSSQYCFAIRDTLLLIPSESWRDFRSTFVMQLLGDRPYSGEKYAVLADAQEISVYNLYTGNLIAKYVAGFQFPPTTIEPTNGKYTFSVPKSVFEEAL